jgi:EAL domain-containing protein (putative c-di-GMP-specific phosphodiesterase class I)
MQSFVVVPAKGGSMMRATRPLIFPESAVGDITYIDIREAVLRREFFLEYQPKVNLQTGRVESVEALIRWQHSSRGRIAPDAFLPLIERTTLMGRLTGLVLDQALAQCAAFNDQGLPIGVAVNISPSAVTRELAGQVKTALQAHDVDADRLTLEITQTDVFADVAQATEILEAIHRTGVRLSLDDFGTGHSSLTRLQALPFDELKIDGSFVGRAVRSPRDAQIVRFSAELGRALKLNVVAEGIEDKRTLALMLANGIDEGQGYHLSLPQSAADLVANFDDISTRTRARALSRSIDLHSGAGTRKDDVIVHIGY